MAPYNGIDPCRDGTARRKSDFPQPLTRLPIAVETVGSREGQTLVSLFPTKDDFCLVGPPGSGRSQHLIGNEKFPWPARRTASRPFAFCVFGSLSGGGRVDPG